MIQIAFQPAYDAFHAIFRYFQISALWKHETSIELDRYRIIDFYLCFPDKLNEFRFQRNHLSYRKISKAFAKGREFEHTPSGRIILTRMKPIQIAALETLSGEGFVKGESLLSYRVEPTDLSPPESLQNRLDIRAESYSQLYEPLSVLLNDYDLLGPSGLKARADLLEYRYDAI